MTLQQYLDSVNQRFRLGNATEHTFRGDLQQLIESIVPHIRATNEPKRQSCGAPDYILTKKDIPVGFIEAKDLGDKDLDGLKKTGNKEQFDRYKGSLNNLIFTDYLSFHLYREGQFILKIAIGEVSDKGIKPLPENFASFENLIKDFASHIGQTIKSPKKLAEMMAGKARLLSDVIEKALNSDESNHEDSTLKDQMKAFKEILIHDITPKGFADVYAQTIAYGMFAARLHDPTLPTFSRQEAAELIPKSNPFLRKLFGYIAGPDIDDRIKWIVDSLVEIFLASNVEEILKNYGRTTKMEDPIIHFYETFLSEYDPKLRKARGVWYTPQPVVSFIVRAVDEILKTEFGLPQGLADTSKTKIKTAIQGHNKPVEQEVHRVQLLDPATGTGTFLAEVVKHIHRKFAGQEGIWSNYLENHLLPRLNGFELLMASYAMAHLKMDLLFKETGYTPTSNQRLRIYLTNSLEESHPDTGTLFANWLSTEANEANHIKRDTPVMCVIGNPPYSILSSNKGEWILKLLEDYKKGVNFKTLNSLSDDYIKFIRFGQYYIEKNKSGILAYISNNSFLDGVTHFKMRQDLCKTFNKIYIIDLHGNVKKKEVGLDGSKDENVFDIQQGVSINIFIKNDTEKKKTKVYHHDLFGLREEKYSMLSKSNIYDFEWQELNVTSPFYFFSPKDFSNSSEYESYFEISKLFKDYNNGVESRRDSVTVQFKKEEIEKVKNDFVSLSDDEIKAKYNLVNESRDWKINWVKEDLKSNNPISIKINYRPFDDRETLYTGKTKGWYGYPVDRIMRNVVNKNNLGLLVCKQQSTFDFQHVLITRLISDRNSVSMQTKESTHYFPLYLYPESSGQMQIGALATRTPNLNMDIVDQIAKRLGLAFVSEKEGEVCFAGSAEVRPEYRQSFAPIDILDYIYAVLHSPAYREKYKAFLKIDFPRVPYPADAEVFWKLVALGGELRQIHLLESPKVAQYITRYPVGGDNVVGKIRFEAENVQDLEGFENLPGLSSKGKVFINEAQYFDGVPEVAWSFYIGGYQPAQKWLKDRKERTLDFEDILHYQKIIVALTETDRIMREIDLVE
jgi:predicted helicase